MKIIIVMILTVLLFISSVGISTANIRQRTAIGRDSAGGYSEAQRDYKKRMYNRQHAGDRSGYYDGSYHNQSSDFRRGKYQFVKSGDKAYPKKRVRRNK